jgi:hypothetical protein
MSIAPSDLNLSTQTSTPDNDVLRDAQSFSLVLGGPLFQLFRRAHLADDALLMTLRRVLVISGVAWVPLLVLSALDGHLVGSKVAVPFLPDLETHIRLLVVVPLLLLAELVVHQRLRPIARAFLERKLIPLGEMSRFDRALKSAYALRNSVVAEVLLLAAVYLVGILIVWRRYTVIDASTWYLTLSPQGLKLSLAGLWYAGVSLPIFQFLLLRWYFRLFIWTRFLWQVSRINLVLVPTHPDQLGGLGMLSNTVYAFTVLLMAHGAMLAGQIAGRILFLGAKLPEFTMEIASMVIFLLCIVFGPLLVFAPQLSRTKRRGLLAYGTFAEGYVRDFDNKWLQGKAPEDESVMGSADIQSLADLANSFGVVRTMRLAPVSRDSVIQLAAAVLVPLAPLLLTIMDVEQLLRKILGLVF